MKLSGDTLSLGSRHPHARHFEVNRWKTFANCFRHFLRSTSRLASAGFHATGRGDHVECSWCGLTASASSISNSPDVFHKSRQPDCPFHAEHIPLTAPCNIPLPKFKKDDSNWTWIQRNNLEPIIQRRQSVQEVDETDETDEEVQPRHFPGVRFRTRRQLRRGNNNLRLAGILRAADGSVPYTAEVETPEDPVFPLYATDRSRQRTYYRFPSEKGELVELLYKSGFFYTGLHDIVTCFNCELSLEDWTVGEDDPQLAHARWRPACSHFVNTSGGQLPRLAQRELQVIGQ